MKSAKGSAILFVIIPVIILIAVFGFFYLQVKSKGGGLADMFSAISTLTQKPGPIDAPKEKVNIYKGFWMPCGFMSDSCQSLMGANQLKDAGANMAALDISVSINEKGEIKNAYPMEFIEKRLSELAHRYYPKGIRMYLVGDIFYTKDLNARGGEPGPVPDEAANNPNFLKNYDNFIIEIAKLAQKYNVDAFSPMNEPDLKLGSANASAWGQKILPKIREVYQGKIIAKEAAAPLLGGGPRPEKNWDINFRGYDAIGVDPTCSGRPEAECRELIKGLLSKVQALAIRDGVESIMFTELGVWGGNVKAMDEEIKVENHRVLFEEGQNILKGFFVLDPPTDLDRGLKGTKTLQEVKLWFTQKLPN